MRIFRVLPLLYVFFPARASSEKKLHFFVETSFSKVKLTARFGNSSSRIWDEHFGHVKKLGKMSSTTLGLRQTWCVKPEGKRKIIPGWKNNEKKYGYEPGQLWIGELHPHFCKYGVLVYDVLDENARAFARLELGFDIWGAEGTAQKLPGRKSSMLLRSITYRHMIYAGDGEAESTINVENKLTLKLGEKNEAGKVKLVGFEVQEGVEVGFKGPLLTTRCENFKRVQTYEAGQFSNPTAEENIKKKQNAEKNIKEIQKKLALKKEEGGEGGEQNVKNSDFSENEGKFKNPSIPPSSITKYEVGTLKNYFTSIRTRLVIGIALVIGLALFLYIYICFSLGSDGRSPSEGSPLLFNFEKEGTSPPFPEGGMVQLAEFPHHG